MSCPACFQVSLLFAMMLRSASSIDWNAFLEEDIVAHFVVFLKYQKDEAKFRDTLEKSMAALIRRRNTFAFCLPRYSELSRQR